MRLGVIPIVVAGVLAAITTAAAQPGTGALMSAAKPSDCVNDPSWIAPQPPFRIFGNTYHVGPRGLGVFLITAPTGHVLIDGGVPGHTRLITNNIRRLGFALRDVKWILNSHAHCDHAGGIAALARATGAQVIAGAADTTLLADGGRHDPHYGDRFPFPPVRVTRAVQDGDTLRLGTLVLAAHATPGHTHGNTTWSWQSCEGTRCLRLIDVGSLSAPDYRLIGNPGHPTIVADYEASFTKVTALACDIALAPHPGMVDFWERVAQRDRGRADALIDATRCATYARSARDNFLDELARQRGASSAPPH
jgi:metallo-beta-lactamase class B